jgi:hypothetical protein
MSAIKSNAFTFPYTFFREPANKVIPELQSYGLSGINLALNYHGSRDLLLRQGPQLEYLSDGFHYYKSDYSKYEDYAIKPALIDQLPNNELLDSVIKVAKNNKFEINAWAVYMHNSAIGMANPEAAVTNVFGNKFLSELCPINPAVAGYAIGLTKDLVSRGINAITAESLHFHGARHGEHHERFFIELSPVSEFLFSLCFCPHCIKNYQDGGSDIAPLIGKVKNSLSIVFEKVDPWLGKRLTIELLAEIIGPDILTYLTYRENKIASVYKDIAKITKEAGVIFKYVDQSPLLDMNSAKAIESSWQIGIDTKQINEIIDCFEPLIYRQDVTAVADLAKNYLEGTDAGLTAILRPTYPDSTSPENLINKVSALVDLGISNIDFYLLDTMRASDLESIKHSINK